MFPEIARQGEGYEKFQCSWGRCVLCHRNYYPQCCGFPEASELAGVAIIRRFWRDARALPHEAPFPWALLQGSREKQALLLQLLAPLPVTHCALACIRLRRPAAPYPDTSADALQAAQSPARICPSCFDQEAEKVAVRYSFADLELGRGQIGRRHVIRTKYAVSSSGSVEKAPDKHG